MSIAGETFVIENPDGSISLDAYAGQTRAELKERCRDLCMAVEDWQMIALTLAEHGRDGLPASASEKLDRLIEGYKDSTD